MSFTIESARTIFPDTQVADAVPSTVESFNQLSAEDQLALLWFAYTEMGVTITPAAISVVNMVFAEDLLMTIKQMPFSEQTQVMCDLVNHADTPLCHTYSSFGTNVKLGFWYQLSEWMKQGIIAPIPKHYKLSKKASEVLQSLRQLEGGQQLTVLQDVVANMGYASNNGYSKVVHPVIPPQLLSPRSTIKIKGISNKTILSYMEAMNAFDFESSVALFTSDGALQPPFKEPIIGRENILAYMQDECYGLKLMPESGISETPENGFTPIKVTGKVQTPWFGGSVVIDLAWRFLLNSENQIFFVGIDLLATPQELLNLTPDQNPQVLHHSDGSELTPSEAPVGFQEPQNPMTGYTKDDEGILNSYSLEPAMSKVAELTPQQRSRYFVMGIGAIAAIAGLLWIVFSVS